MIEWWSLFQRLRIHKDEGIAAIHRLSVPEAVRLLDPVRPLRHIHHQPTGAGIEGVSPLIVGPGPLGGGQGRGKKEEERR